MSPIEFLCPLAIEAAFLRRGLPRSARVTTAGPGCAAMAGAIRGLLARPGIPPSAIVIAGVAGGLTIPAGQVVLANAVLDEHGAELFMPAWLPDLPGAHVGAIVGASSPICTPEEKARLADRSGALAVDTESQALASIDKPACKVLVVRAVSDGPDDALPERAGGWIDAQGRTKIAGVLTDLVFRRTRVRDLTELNARTTAALRALLDASRGVIDACAAAGDGR